MVKVQAMLKGGPWSKGRPDRRRAMVKVLAVVKRGQWSKEGGGQRANHGRSASRGLRRAVVEGLAAGNPFLELRFYYLD